MKLPTRQQQDVRASADCVDGCIAGEINNRSDWFVTVVALEVRLTEVADQPVRASEFILRLPDPVPPGGRLTFSVRNPACSGSGRWRWSLVRVYGFPCVARPANIPELAVVVD